ncbi:hypothetical protein ABEB36_013649 [Hypothenemus hampei]|uniref:Retrotransposon gag domain-containing protein n=1 Tax=Hypothenemus hampei TaxID=57062 RepID=A0ABD1E4U5_HYPHA
MEDGEPQQIFEEINNFRSNLAKDSKERCVDSKITDKKWQILKTLHRKYNDCARKPSKDFTKYEPHIAKLLDDCIKILKQRKESISKQETSEDDSVFLPATDNTSRQQGPPTLQTTTINAQEISTPTPFQRQVRKDTKPNIVTMDETSATLLDANNQFTHPATPRFIEPPTYNPSTDCPTVFLKKYDRAGNCNRWNDICRISYLEGSAVGWFEAYRNNPSNLDKNWETIKTDFRAEFMEGSQQSLYLKQFQQKTQGSNETIRHYYYELLNLANEADPQMPFEEFENSSKKDYTSRTANPTIC